MASQWPPKKNTAFTLYFTLYKNDGTVIANPGTITKKYSIDGAAVGDCSNSITEEDTTYGQCSLVLSQAEMNGDAIWVQIKDDTAGCIPFTCVLYTTANTQDEIGANVAAILADTGTDGVVVAAGSKTGYSLANGSIAAATFAAGAVDAAALAADAGTEIGAAVKTAIEAAGSHLTLIKAKTDNLPASPAAVGSAMGLVDDAITAAKFDESTAFPLKSADAGATQVARTGADGDTLETISDQLDAVPTAEDNADQVWDEAIADHAGVGSTGEQLAAAGAAGDPWSTPLPGAYGAGTAGKIVGDNLDAAISSRSSHNAAAVKTAIEAAGSHLTLIKAVTDAQGGTGSGLSAVPWNAAWDAEVQSECADAITAAGLSTLDAAGVRTAVGMAGADLDAQLAALPTANENADALLMRNIAGGSSVGRTVTQALRALRNKIAIAAGTMTVYEEDDTTPDWTGAVTTDPAAEPITEIDPA